MLKLDIQVQLNRVILVFPMNRTNRDCFIKNYCRICNKFMCCERCVANHQIKKHKNSVPCTLCHNGFTQLIKKDIESFSHIELKHLPLYCISCEKNVSNRTDMLQHEECLVRKAEQIKKKSNALLFKTSTPRTAFAVDVGITKYPEGRVLDNVSKQKSLKKVTFKEVPIQLCKLQQVSPITTNESTSETFWESALGDSFDLNIGSDIYEFHDNASKQLSPIIKKDSEVHYYITEIESAEAQNTNEGIWNVFSNMLKSVIDKFPTGILNDKKRNLSDDDLNNDRIKRMKLCKVESRRPIH